MPKLGPLFKNQPPFPNGIPEAPPWRRFTEPAAADYAAPTLSASAAGRGETFQCDETLDRAVEAAMILRRPLLVTGLPGTGKSTLAYAVAKKLDLGAILRWNITSRSTRREGLYDYDALGRLNATQLACDPKDLPSIGEYLRLGPLGTALLPLDRPRVLLIDELDKSDIDLPNDLLHLFEEGSFEIPELQREKEPAIRVRTADDTGDSENAPRVTLHRGQIACRAFPVIVITSNGEREFSPAFLRRCIQYAFPTPNSETLKAVIAAHLKENPPTERDRRFVLDRFLELQKSGDVATDQLLNALHVIRGRPAADRPFYRDLILTLLSGNK